MLAGLAKTGYGMNLAVRMEPERDSGTLAWSATSTAVSGIEGNGS